MRSARKYYFRCKKNFNINKTDANNDILRKASKLYKLQHKHSHRKYLKKLNILLKSMVTKEPREYWSILMKPNKANVKEKPKPNDLFEHFRKLNTCEKISKGVEVELKGVSDYNQNELLNHPFTQKEVEHCIKN